MLEHGRALEFSILFRATMFAILFIGLGVEVLRAHYNVSRFTIFLGWLSIVVGVVNALIAVQWVYYFVFTETTII